MWVRETWLAVAFAGAVAACSGGGDTDFTDVPAECPEEVVPAWFPRFWTRVQVVEDGVPVHEYPFWQQDPEHPGYLFRSSDYIETVWFGHPTAWLSTGRIPVPVEQEASSDPPETLGEGFTGSMSMQGDRIVFDFTAGSAWRFECERRIRPAYPHEPWQQQELLCTDQDGVQTVWINMLYDPLDERGWRCLGQHEPPELPTRWSLMRRTDGLGRGSSFPHETTEGSVSRTRLIDLVLRRDGTGEEVLQATDNDRSKESYPLSWPLREATEHTWTRTEDGLAFAFADGRTMACTRAELGEFADEARTFALECVEPNGTRTRWEPMDMGYPWGWGSHATPEGWWW